MKDIYKLAEVSLVNFLINKHSPVSKTSKFGFILMSIAAVFFVIGIGFFLYSIYNWFLLTYAPFEASILLGFIFLGLAFLFIGVLFALTIYQRKKIIQMRTSITDDIKSFIDLIENDIDTPKPLSENPKTSVAIATLIGFVLGDRYL